MENKLAQLENRINILEHKLSYFNKLGIIKNNSTLKDVIMFINKLIGNGRR